ncbi:MAG: 1,4-dihydroxy-2-naphthoate polyprenyltransferase [Actinomycetia bacterium]|nr:1,4-dihydroxy-2-naphthoate polyprenyltransferase [Actinomycetes bacterium]
MATASQWIAGARPRTLPAAFAPVAVGTGVAGYEGSINPLAALLALLVSVSLQIGVNYANDYSDGVKGTDKARVGPVRLVGQGLASAQAVRAAALLTLAIGGGFGFLLVALTQTWWLLIVGALAIAAAWLYTGGPRPYGYAGLGEAFVFVFFGIVAVVGTAYTQVGYVSAVGWVAAFAPGLWSVAILMVNNIRDIPGDRTVGKRTLAVRLGNHRSRNLFSGTVLAGFLAVVLCGLWTPWALLGMLALPLAISPIRIVQSDAAGKGLIPALGTTSRVLLAGGLLLGLGLGLGGP